MMIPIRRHTRLTPDSRRPTPPPPPPPPPPPNRAGIISVSVQEDLSRKLVVSLTPRTHFLFIVKLCKNGHLERSVLCCEKREPASAAAKCLRLGRRFGAFHPPTHSVVVHVEFFPADFRLHRVRVPAGSRVCEMEALAVSKPT